jgi:hypothetical protein
MHAYQAYRADGKFEAVMDSGANINIFTDELENGLSNARQSRIHLLYKYTYANCRDGSSRGGGSARGAH